jgi:hypothetical protein
MEGMRMTMSTMRVKMHERGEKRKEKFLKKKDIDTVSRF